MIEIEQIAPNAHRILVIAEFRQAESEQLVAFARERLKAGGGGSVLLDIASMAGFSWSAVAIELAHVPLLLKWLYSLDRIAILSDEDWIRSAARLESALLPGVAYEVYDDDEADAARAWVIGEADAPHHGAFRPLDLGKPDTGKPGIAAFELSGRLDRAESERALALVRATLEENGCSRLLLHIRDWHGFDLDTLLSGALFSGKLDLIGRLDRYAVVGGPDWLGGMANMIGGLIKPEMRAFELDELDDAVAWLEG